MTTIEGIWTRIGEIVREYEAPDGTQYGRARDPFSFELDPRGDVPAFFLDPPALDQGVQFVGGGGAVLARCTIWLSRPRGEDADRQALALATDCGELRRLIDEAGMDWFVQPGASVRLSTGDEGDVTVIGALAFVVDYEEDD